MRTLIRTIALASIALATTTSIASAQTAPPVPTAPVARTAAPVAPGGAVVGAPVGSIAKNLAASEALARQAYLRNIQLKQTECQAKGAMYLWKPPHMAGEADGTGKFYTNNTSGSCRRIVTAKQMEALQAAGMLR